MPEYDFLSDDQKELMDFFNKNEYLYKARVSEKTTGVLRTVYLHVNNVCNFSCKGCYSGKLRCNEASFIDNQSAYKIAEELVLEGCEKVIISGGEPMLSENLYSIVKIIKTAGISNLSIISNGSYNIEDYIKLYDYVDEISFSLDGFDEISSIIRPKNTVQKIEKLVFGLKEKRKNVSLIFTIHHQNVSSIDSFIGFINELQVPFNFSAYLSFENNDSFKLTNQDFVYMNEWIKRYSMHQYLEQSNISYRETCGLAKHICSIDQELNLYPCHMMMSEKYLLGNLKDTALHEILTQEKTVKMQNDFLFQNKPCKTCDVKYFCGGG